MTQRILITGASSGIGLAAARAFSQLGYEVHALARRAERLSDLAAEIECVVHVADVVDYDQFSEVISTIEPDVLINNAGLGRAMGSLAEAERSDITRTIDTNVTAVMVACRAALPSMIEQGSGHIVNVGSMAGLYQLPAALYGASKAAVHLLSSNLRLELVGTGVRVTEICPGRVATEFYDVAIDDPAARATVQQSGIEEITAADVADAIVYAVQAPPRVNVNRIELQPTEQTYGGSQFSPVGN